MQHKENVGVHRAERQNTEVNPALPCQCFIHMFKLNLM